MKIHNTLTHTIEPFEPYDKTMVRIYSCGPTVYDHIHIGNLSAFIMADTLRRALTISGFPVKHVMNFTDVDDKTIRRSQERYPDMNARQALQKLTTEYSDLFMSDMALVGNDSEAYTFVRATDDAVMQSMQELIQKLHTGGFAYVADDGVYFSIEAYKESGKRYGQLSDISTSSTSEARIQNDEYDKESAHDFALWKKQKGNEPAWQFELDGQDMTGRPGWHIECSIMSAQSLGQPFDIHTGGIDLIFPHHENEIAQSTAGQTEDIYARYFIHNEHILVDGKKMSKRLGNFYTLRDIVDKGYDPLTFRLLVLQSHYRSQAHFSWENLDAAKNRLHRWRAAAAMRWQEGLLPASDTDIDAADFEESLSRALTNDLDTVTALQLIDVAMDKTLTGSICGPCLDDVMNQVAQALGIHIHVDDITDEQKQHIADREQARVNKDWQLSDKIRDKLLVQDIGLRDTPNGAVWYRI